MKKYDYLVWDLDGTITDSARGIMNSAAYALEKCGVKVEDKDTLYKFIGPPLWESFERFYGFTKKEADTAVSYFREYYKEHGMYENEVYEGISSLLEELQKAGRTNILATSKAEVFAVQVLDYFGLSGYFAHVAGASMDGTRVDKADVIAYAFDQFGMKDLSGAVMIGDREHDMIGAKACGIAGIGVLYGYGSRKELVQAGADAIAETTAKLKELLL